MTKENPTFKKGEALTARKLNRLSRNAVTEIIPGAGATGTRSGNKQTITPVKPRAMPGTMFGKLKSRAGNVYTFDQVKASISGSGNTRTVSWTVRGYQDVEAIEVNGVNYDPWDYSLGTPAWLDIYVQVWRVEGVYMFTMPMIPPPGDDDRVLIVDDTNSKIGWDYPRIHS